ncbi:putative ABC transport system ATP-binding protein [Arcanobacterium wilhelmae]|uniref:ABC transport system ATP-binding protein n=1 Tax=Arcanobacterium wilhelmae TaxID=1803177 RepID=A0ABT9ND80_9ACTO|nr:ABC transporter ATP-binding protein [Arcanobacterium wilhelmae]MDP9801664.1 putative ABC transport system ATP-binding protein [Arcanobacterium wilhelmae]WFN90985.1 ABC transporter ATP-binding protein [Arcanobacterium wilhelmae]
MNTMNLRGRGLKKMYGPVHALAGVDIDIPQGEQVAIMGPSGSGKSTLLHVLSGILTPDQGTVELGETTVSKLSDAKRSALRRRQLGFVFQDGQLVPELTARENVAFPLLLEGVSKAKALAEAENWLGRLGVADQARKRPGEMSGGQAQRVAIARALVHRPAILFADEPTGALDQATGHEVMQILTTTAQMNGTTLVVITHDAKVAAWCQRLVEIRDGLVHFDGPAARADAGARLASDAGARRAAPGTHVAQPGQMDEWGAR